MLLKYRFDNVKPLYKPLNILPLTKNIKLLQGKFIRRLIAKKHHPDSITEQLLLHFKEAINSTNTEKLIISYYRTSMGKNHYHIKDTKSGISKFLQTPRTKKAITILLKLTISIY